MKRILGVATVVVGVWLTAAPMVAQSNDRLTDTDVKGLIEKVDQARDRFEDQLDGKVKNGIVRGPAGEIQVKSSLEDFQRDLSNLKSRFTNDYAASAEVQTVLRQANALKSIMQVQPSGLKGASEWDKLSAELKGLAAAYYTEFPFPEGAATRRINDTEVANSVAALAEQAELLKKAVNADKTLPKPEKETLKGEVEDVIKQANLLESRLKDHKPATAEMRTLREKLALLTAEGRKLPDPVLKAIGPMRAPLAKINQAFGFVEPTS